MNFNGSICEKKEDLEKKAYDCEKLTGKYGMKII